MYNISLWNQLGKVEKEEYIQFLQIFGALSGLFKDITGGKSADQPYLYYRNHEQLFARVFDVEDLTRADSAFDAIARINDEIIGIGLKTWIHSRDITFQKVAEFNKVALTEIKPLIHHATLPEIARRIAELRNERILLDIRTYKTTRNIYHNVTRDHKVMNIMECDYHLIDLDSICKVKKEKSGISFIANNKKYKFYESKSVLLEEFDASARNILKKIPISIYEDPFELLAHISLKNGDRIIDKNIPVIYLPLYSDKSRKVEEKSGLNAWNAAPKTKDSDRLRPDFEAYIPIPIWIHHLYPNFFGFNALSDQERNGNNNFKLHLPSGEIIDAIVTQQNGKSLQTNPQSILGKWILHDVLGLNARELLTIKRLDILGVDSLKISKLDSHNFKIDLAETYAFEEWKLSLQSEIENCSDIKNKPEFRPELVALE